MEEKEVNYKTYEDAARALLSDVRSFLGLGEVTGEQKLAGRSGTVWTVEGSAYDVSNERLVLVECKQRKTSALNQETIGGFAYRVNDTGADRGIIITTVGLQKGAKLVADAERITVIKLDYNATSENYIAEIADQLFLKVTDRIRVGEEVNVEIEPPSNDT